ncbi:MAG: hypothetical protein AAF266_05725 [Planctomycetota bacterium]
MLPLALLATGCHLVLPEVSQQPLVHNPFPQLSRVAVVPFFNQSAEPTVDGRQFAAAYYAELQDIPGFEVVPVTAVEAAMRQWGITFDPPEQAVDQARWLAKKLGVDAVVIGTVTDYSPYYPPRCGVRVEWYAANEGFHEIPAGYGLPWGTSKEEYIPDRLVFEAEMALARAQMETQSPTVAAAEATHELQPMREPAALEAIPLPPPADPFDEGDADIGAEQAESLPPPPNANPLRDDAAGASDAGNALRGASFDEPIDASGPMIASDASAGAFGANGMLPEGWPDARGFTPPGPSPVRPTAEPNPGPVMTHTRVFRGSDPDFTAALASYVGFRDDARFGGWQSYLSRSDDFVRFCCHLHLVEMLSARGGSDQTRVVRRWSDNR